MNQLGTVAWLRQFAECSSMAFRCVMLQDLHATDSVAWRQLAECFGTVETDETSQFVIYTGQFASSEEEKRE